MKSITTCPSCQTQFLVTDEQLSQYSGKVRCGHCLNVFNAIDYISVPVAENLHTEIVAGHTEAADVDTQKIEHEFAQEPANIENAEVLISSEATDDLASTANNIEQETVHSEAMSVQIEAPEVVSASEPEITISDSTADMTPEIHRADVLKELFAQAELPLEEVLDATRKSDDAVSQENAPVESEFNPDVYQEEVSKINEFDYKPEYQYFLEQKKSTSTVLLGLGVLFVLLALLQLLFFYRHTIAMQYPYSKPTLVGICQVIGCKINLPKEIQLFSIDDSTIAEDSDHQGVIRLTSTITNRANFNQAYPNLEVTLTDTQDKPKLRRIFKPSEYLAKGQRLDEGIASGDSIEIDMPLMADDFKPAGFRLLVSY